MAKTCETTKLTKRAVDAAKPLTMAGGVVRQRLYLDTDLPGFGLCVGATTKSFFAQRSVRGRSVRCTIGRYPVFTVDQARREAQQALAKMARGLDPVDEARKARVRGLMLRQALELCTQTMQTRGRSERTISDYTYSIETYLKDWLDRPLAEITRHEVRERHLKIAADIAAGRYARGHKRTKGHGRHSANAAMVAFRTVYNRALREHPELPANPIINVDFFKTEKRNALPISQLHFWHKKVMALENPIRRDYLRFALFTGLRRTNAAEAQWSHVDFERRLLHVPKPKSGRPFDLPLPETVIALLRERKKGNEKDFAESPFIFPAMSESGHISEPREEFDGIQWTPHDLRRWFITTAESLDLSPYAIKMLVNHAMPSGDVTAGYVQHEVERLRPAMEAVAAKLLNLCEPPPQGKVIRLSAKRKQKGGQS
jgi:integrase